MTSDSENQKGIKLSATCELVVYFNYGHLLCKKCYCEGHYLVLYLDGADI
jgi:hypothetical protein